MAVVSMLVIVAWPFPACAQLEQKDAKIFGPGWPPGDYYSYVGAPFSIDYIAFYKRESDGNLYPVTCDDASFHGGQYACRGFHRIESIGPLSFAEQDTLARDHTGWTEPTNVPAQYWSGLKDLVPGGLAHGKWPPPYKIADGQATAIRNLLAGKRILLVLSSDTEHAFAALDDLQHRIAAWAADQSDAGIRAAAGKLAGLETRKIVASNVVKELSSRRAQVTFADDLSTFHSGGYDFAMVVDVNASGSADAFLKVLDAKLHGRGQLPESGTLLPFGVELSAALFDQDLRVFWSRIRDRRASLTSLEPWGATRPRAVAGDLDFFASYLRSTLGDSESGVPIVMELDLPDDKTY